jgi:2-polyprenyl-3-methyl-5-hydroxy-6-metoxy-1,4-benzoquinol methylase
MEARAEAYDQYYRDLSKYEDASVATGGGDDPADRQRLDELAKFLTAQIETDARVLDIGCGNGGLLIALREYGFTDLTGFDPAIACVERIQSQGIPAYALTLPLADPVAISERLGLFDLIVLSHVLEHVFDVKAVLASLLPLLTANGYLYLETPDPTRYSNDGFPPLYFFDSEHINHLSAESLAYLAETLGLVPQVCGQKALILANGSAYPAVFSLLRNGGTPNIPKDTGPRLYQPLLTYLQKSLADLEPLRERILSLIGNHRPFALWGAGSLSQRLVGTPWFPRDNLCAVVDRDRKKHGLSFAGQIIASPEVGLRNLPDNALVLCAAAITSKAIEKDYQALQLPYPFHVIVE